MRKLTLLLLVCALIGLPGVARAEGAIWVDDDVTNRFHATDRCALAAGNPLENRGGPTSEYFPCQACVADETEYAGVACWARGGTAIVRLPDAWIEAALSEDAAPGEVPDALIHGGGSEDADLARLVHGRAYVDLLAALDAGSTQAATAFVPEYVGGDLLMSCRHLGAAWYLAVRPEGGTDGFALPLRLWRADLEVEPHPAGVTLRAAGAICRELEAPLTPVPSSGEVTLRWEDGDYSGLDLYVVRDGDVNALVVRMKYCDPDDPDDPGLNRLAAYVRDQFALNGYMDGEDGVFVAAVTDGEVNMLRQKVFLDMNAAPVWRTDFPEPAAAAQLAGDYTPVSETVLPDGTLARLTAAAYPVGTPFVACELTRPEGGIADFWNRARLQWLHGGAWHPVGDSTLRGRVDGDADRAHPGWFCDRVNLVWPIEGFGALREGLYRISVDSTEDPETGETVDTWLEFRVRSGAPQPSLPAPTIHRAPDFDLPVHAAPHADPSTYNSCADTSRARLADGGWRLLAGDVVYELRGVDESWGWEILSRYSLFAYPAGQPERAALLIDGFDPSDVALYDLGDGLLLIDNGNGFWHCDLDGGNLREIGRAFAADGALSYGGAGLAVSAAEDADGAFILDALPVGDAVYLATEKGIWVTGLDEIRPRLVYQAKQGILNGEAGRMVYAGGRLFVADGGIVAVDTARTGADGLMAARRLTDAYDPEDGDCGLGYIALNGRLYYWSAEAAATVSVDLDGGDLQTVSKERFWFSAVSPDGAVLALTGSRPGLFGDERTGAALYLPTDPGRPTFDPDRCEKRSVAPGSYDTLLGGWLVHMDAAGNETWERLNGGATAECLSRAGMPYWHRDANCRFGEALWRENGRAGGQTRGIAVAEAEAEGQKPCPGCATAFVPTFSGSFPEWGSALAPWGDDHGEMTEDGDWPRGEAELPVQVLAGWGDPAGRLFELFPACESWRAEDGDLPEDYAGVFTNACGGATLLLTHPTGERVAWWRETLGGEFWVLSARHSRRTLNALARFVEQDILEEDARRARDGEGHWYHIVSVGIDDIADAVTIGVTSADWDEGVERIRAALAEAGYTDPGMVRFVKAEYPTWL